MRISKTLLVLALTALAHAPAYANVEEEKWQQAQERNTLEAYRSFVAEFSSGTPSDATQLRLRTAEFRIARLINSISSYQRFIRRHPADSPEVEEANGRIAELMKDPVIAKRVAEEARRAEQRSRATEDRKELERLMALQAEKEAFARFQANPNLFTAIAYVQDHGAGENSASVWEWFRARFAFTVVPGTSLQVALLGTKDIKAVQMSKGMALNIDTGRLSPKVQTYEAGRGNRLLGLNLLFLSTGGKASINRETLKIASPGKTAVAAISWQDIERDVDVSDAEAFPVQPSAALTFVYEVQSVQPEKLVIFAGSTRMSTLAELRRR